MSVILIAAILSGCHSPTLEQKSGQQEIEVDTENRRSVEAERLGKLLSLPYVRGSVPGRERVGVTIYDRTQAWDGYNLYCSSHAPAAYLMSMEGKVLHTWHLPMDSVWPDLEILPENEGNQTFWRRVHLWDNGDLLVVFSGLGLVKIDRDSRLIWAHQGGEHHDFAVTPGGEIFALARKRTMHPGFDRPILEDFIHILEPEGSIVRSFSLLNCIKRSGFTPLLDNLEKRSETAEDDITERLWRSLKEVVSPGLPVNLFHANTIEYLDGSQVERSPVFEKGNLLVALRNLNTLVIVDPSVETAVWAMWDRWRFPHQPTLLSTGNILIFDNLHSWNGSAVLEFDPLTGEEGWGYQGNPENPFFSPTQGSNQRLPNGNTLITDSNNGRAFEVTHAGDIVWEFCHPHRVGSKRELTANLCELIRLNPEMGLEWLDTGR